MFICSVIFFIFSIFFSGLVLAKEMEVDKYKNLSKYQLGWSLGYTNFDVNSASIEGEVISAGATKDTSFLPLNTKLFFRSDVGGERVRGLYVETGFEYVGKYTTQYRADNYMLDIYNQNFFGYVGLLKYIAMTDKARFFLSGGMIYGKVMSGYQYDLGGGNSSISGEPSQNFGANGTNNTDVNFYLNFGFQFDIANSPVGIELSYDYYPAFDGESTGDNVCLPGSPPSGACNNSANITYGDVKQFNINLGVYYNIDSRTTRYKE